MSRALEIATRLGDERTVGREVKCCCPLCGGRLALREGERGLLAKCWGGCDAGEVYAELRRLGHIPDEPPAPLSLEERAAHNASAERERRRKIAQARWLWDTGSPIKDTLGDTYLRARGLDVFSPYLSDRAASELRFLRRAWHSPGILRPAIVAAIEHVEHGFIGAHVTYLAIDGSGKAALDPPRKILGTCKGGAVRLGEPRVDEWLIVAEGIETALSVAVACAAPAWAALSASGICSVVLPPDATHILIAADNDVNHVGELAARKAAARFSRGGRWTKVVMPQSVGTDFNNNLMLSDAEEACHVA